MCFFNDGHLSCSFALRSYFPHVVRLFVRSSGVRLCFSYHLHSFVRLFVRFLARQHLYITNVSRFCFNFLDKLLHFRNRGKIDNEKWEARLQ